MRVYIAGPMTGLPNLNYDTFNEAARTLGKMGHEVYNPASTFNGAYLDLPYDIWLREAIRLVSMVNGMVLLPGWHMSRGALTEIHIGLSLGMPFYQLINGQLIGLDMDYRNLIDAMDYYYLGRGVQIASSGSVSEVRSGDSREAESGEDNRFGSVTLPVPKLEATLVR